MASISEVYDELQSANDKLDTLHADLQQVLNRLQTIQTEVTTGFGGVIGTLNVGFAALTKGAQGLIALQSFANDVLLHHSKQNDTIICILENISKNTCNLEAEAHLQTGLQISIEKKVSLQTEISKTVNAAVALELERMEALRRQIEECCPPTQEPPACTYVPCDAPRFGGEPPRPDPPRFEPVVR